MFGKQNDSLFEASQQTNKLKIKHVKFSNLFLLIRLAHSLRDKQAIKLLSNLRHSNTYSFEWDEDRKRIPIILDKYSQKYSFVNYQYIWKVLLFNRNVFCGSSIEYIISITDIRNTTYHTELY